LAARDGAAWFDAADPAGRAQDKLEAYLDRYVQPALDALHRAAGLDPAALLKLRECDRNLRMLREWLDECQQPWDPPRPPRARPGDYEALEEEELPWADYRRNAWGD
jgi:hypothetical protein